MKVYNEQNDNEHLWDKNKFVNRYYSMQEIYQNYIEGHKDWDVPPVIGAIRLPELLLNHAISGS